MLHDPVNIDLIAPIKHGGQDLMAITLRPMTGRDLRECGFPCVIGPNGQYFDADACSRLVARLANVTLAAVDMMQASDWQKCINAVAGFLGERKAPTSSD